MFAAIWRKLRAARRPTALDGRPVTPVSEEEEPGEPGLNEPWNIGAQYGSPHGGWDDGLGPTSPISYPFPPGTDPRTLYPPRPDGNWEA